MDRYEEKAREIARLCFDNARPLEPLIAAALRAAHTAGAVEALREAYGEADNRWSFTETQQHTHSWHDKQDFLEWIRAKADEREATQ